MGSWGPGIFDNDTAADIRGEYRELLEDQVPDAEATRLVIASFGYLRSTDGGELWIALAAAQTQVGRLDPDVKAAALAAIDTGSGLEFWADAGPTELAKRVAALQRLRDQLTAPQPAAKKLRRSWRYEETELAAGDVLAYSGANTNLALFRVAGIQHSRLGDAPWLEWLDWTGKRAPRPGRIARLKPIQEPATRTMPQCPVIYTVTRFRKSDPGWSESGFVHLTRLPGWPDRDDLGNNFSAGWRALSRLVVARLEHPRRFAVEDFGRPERSG